MKNICLVLVLLLSLTSTAVARGDQVRGEPLTATCAACHGADGNSQVGSFPKLAAQGQAYLFKQMLDVQQGERVITEMTGMLDDMSEQDLWDIAAFYEAQTLEIGQADPELAVLGERLYRAGNPETGVPSCSACHSPTGRGNDLALYPLLSGQHPEYTASQLRKFQRGYLHEGEPTNEVRVNDGEAMIMRSIAFRLRDHEIEALAAYISGLN